jgi:hypothetical protein
MKIRHSTYLRLGKINSIKARMSLGICSITRGMAASGKANRGEAKVRGGAFSRNGGGTILQTIGVILALLFLCALACLLSLFLEKCSRDVFYRGGFGEKSSISRLAEIPHPLHSLGGQGIHT